MKHRERPEDFEISSTAHTAKLGEHAWLWTRFTLAACYFREAQFFAAAYHDHNPYTHALLVILKCSQAIEILFGGQRDTIRQRCSALGIERQVIESQIVSVVVARSNLGPAHASGFVPSPREVDILRQFAQRSVHTVRQLLLLLGQTQLQNHEYLTEAIKRDRDKEKLLSVLEESVKAPLWSVEGRIDVRHVKVDDPRLRASN